MARCFPFPPPGFDRKHRPEDFDVLKEERQKEKRHKKEDEERREGKEKRRKEKSDEKHRENKDQKDKHKDKREKQGEKKKEKEKERGKDKGKSSISDKSTVAGKPGERSGEKVHSGGHSKSKSSFTDAAKRFTQFLDPNGGKLSQNSHFGRGIEESKFVQELDRRLSDDKGTGSQLFMGVRNLDKRDQEAAARAGNRDSSGASAEDKGNNKAKRVDNRKMDVQGCTNEFSADAMVQNNVGMDESKVEAMPIPLEEHIDSRLEGKEIREEKSEDILGDKWKNKDRDKVHGKNKDKKEKKEEKAKAIRENKTNEQDGSKYVGRNDLVGVTSNRSTHLLMDINNGAVDEGNIQKVKDVCINGFLHESEVRPKKLQKLISHQLTENGRKFDGCQHPSVSASYKQVCPNNIRLDNKNWRVTAAIEARELCASKPKPSAATTTDIAETSTYSVHPDSKFLNDVLTVPKMEDKIAEASNRPPHPDSKYLSKVLIVPKMDELQFDEHEWLFSKKDPPFNKPKVGFWGVNGEMSVWSEAMYIESADVYALPYVIPY